MLLASLERSAMGPKEIKLSTAARERLLAGVEIVARTVGVTLGPWGRSVLLERRHARPWVSTDGYTIARHIDLPDRFEDMGGRIIRHVGSKVIDDAGDGSTTAMILAGAMIKEGMRAMAVGLSPVELRRGIERAVAAALRDISGLTTPALGDDLIARIGTVSANGDAEIGSVLARAIDQVGQQGVVKIEDGKGIDRPPETDPGAMLV
jgi:chaperonin GroEL